MDNTTIATLIGVGVQTISTVLQTYVTFKKSNVEKFFQLLLDENKDLSKIGTNEKLKRLFFSIIDNVSKEVTEEKIRNWKNLIVKLTEKFDKDDFNENFSKILDDLTAFDLTVLFAIYSLNFQSNIINKEILVYFKEKNISEDKIHHSLKVLSRNYLIIEAADATTYLTGAELSSQSFFYEKNMLGHEFLDLIND